MLFSAYVSLEKRNEAHLIGLDLNLNPHLRGIWIRIILMVLLFNGFAILKRLNPVEVITTFVLFVQLNKFQLNMHKSQRDFRLSILKYD